MVRDCIALLLQEIQLHCASFPVVYNRYIRKVIQVLPCLEKN